MKSRRARIVVTLGPASSSPERIKALIEAGADVFRLNFSHGTHADHAERLRIIREAERAAGRPIGVLLDLQGPKLRVGNLAGGSVKLEPGQSFRLDLDCAEGDARRVNLPHPEIFAALKAGADLLINDGKLRLRVNRCGPDFAETTVMVGGMLSDHKGVNLPDAILPISPLTEKDRADLDFGLSLGVDWVALSFVQSAEDIVEARAIIGSRAWIMVKLEKPAAMEHLDAIIEQCDGVMVARGDLGVEMPPEKVPVLQQRIVSKSRAAGRPVVVATQMLESMITAPVPTRAEASDVATAVYSGADAVMLSAESATGQYPVEAVAIMERIIREVESDPTWRAGLDATNGAPRPTNTPDAICSALRRVASLLRPAATVAYTASGFSALRASRERPTTPILALTPELTTARRLTMAWGIHPVPFETQLDNVSDMIDHATSEAVTTGLARTGDQIIVIAGLPFGRSGSTNLLHIATI
ncbi:MAG: pyruvate kinase, partial [Candidimonas sp.]